MTKQAAELMSKAVERRAMEIVALPADEREAYYSFVRDVYRKSCLQLGRTDRDAQELADKMVEFTRALVGIIETSGGTSGGKA